MKHLRTPRMDRCIGCQCCVLACARLVHKLHSWTTAGIHIRSSGGLTTGFEADVCVACEPAPCAQTCPTAALTQRKGGGVIVRHELCLRCGECAGVCPVKAIQMEQDSGLPYLCVHCGQCAPFCPYGCIEFTDDADRDAPDDAIPVPSVRIRKESGHAPN
ncbi:MAG: 4Fe-4S binding protein [Desulfovibrio sp.]|jgi:Fe-S-cluster-containing hydrogenase component 2|nr:4Fe-4S binding protein [Desulfovibrio sp.]